MIRISSTTADNNPLIKRSGIVRSLCVAIASLTIAAGFVMLQGQNVSAEGRHDVQADMTLRLAQADTQMNDATPVLVITGKPSAQARKQIRVIPLFNVPADQAQTVERR